VTGKYHNSYALLPKQTKMLIFFNSVA